MNEEYKLYRQQLIELEQKIHEGYDKTLIALSGGALGISFTFVKDIIGETELKARFFILASWSSWALSLSFLLGAFYFGTFAYRYAVKMIDKDKLDVNNPGGCYASIMRWANAFGGCFFIIGLALFIYFSYINMGT